MTRWLVTLLVVLLPSLARGQMTGLLETPDGSVRGIIPFRGWVFTTAPGAEIEPQVELFIDDVSVGSAPCCSPRGDVQSQFAGAPLESGFSATWNWGLVPAGTVTVKAVARDTSGHALTMEKQIEVSPIAPGMTFVRDIDVSEGRCFVPSSAQGYDVKCANVFVESADGRAFCEGGVKLRYERSTNAFVVEEGCTSSEFRGCIDVGGTYRAEISTECGSGPGALGEVVLEPLVVTQEGCDLTLTSPALVEPGSATMVGEEIRGLTFAVTAAANGTADDATVVQPEGTSFTVQPQLSRPVFAFIDVATSDCSQAGASIEWIDP